MAALFNPVYRKGERIKWWLVSYTVVMFSAATVFTWVNIDLLSIAYIDNREFPDEGKLPPGPYGYQLFISSGALNVATNAMFLSSWLAEGLLVSSLFGAPFTHTLTTAPSLALSLLRNLLQEPLDHNLPLPCVPKYFGYEFQFSTSQW